MTRVLLVGDWNWPFLAVARTCRGQGIRAYLLDSGRAERRWRRYSSCLDGGRTMDHAKFGTENGILAVRGHASELKADAVVAVDDPVLLWLARHRREFEPGCRLLMPRAEVLWWAGSKRNQTELAAEIGFDVLPTRYLSGQAGVGDVPANLYPLVLRPDRQPGYGRFFKASQVNSPAELGAAVRVRAPQCGTLIAQPRLSLPNLVVHGARSEAGQILRMEAFLVPRKFEGVTLTIMPTRLPARVERCCRDFLERTGITGCFHFELLLSAREGRVWFLEINTRLGGTTDKVRALGFDEPLFLLQSYGVLPVDRVRRPLKPGIAANRRALLRHALWAVMGRLTALDYPEGTRIRQAARSARDFLLAKDSVFEWSDIRGILWERGR